jgi:hypothetical protein
MPSRTFNFGTDQNGGQGWIMRGMPHFDAVQGLGAAHDTIEHFGLGARLEDELLAFGAILFGRGEGGYWNMRANRTFRTGYAYQASGDLARFLAEARLEVQPIKPLLLDEHLEEMLEELPEHVLTSLGDELECWGMEDASEAQILNAIGHAINWIRRGYNKAAKRFTCSPDFVAVMFDSIERDVDAIKGAEEGDTLKISFDLDGLNWDVKHTTPYYR